jgi:rod shape-determining protein MreC
MQYKKNNFQNRYILVGLIIISIVFTTVFYREPGEGPFHVIKRFTLSSVSSVQAGASIVLRPVVNGWYFISESIGDHDENITLKEKIAELNRKVETLEFASQENTRLNELLKVSKKKNLKTKLANIIGYSSNDLEKVIVIDKGLNDGLKKRMPVITNQGLVGQIINLTGKAAQVQLITDSKSGVSVETMKVGVMGVVEGSENGKLKMNLVNKNSNLKAGDSVFTSGLGGVYPKGIYVGNVESVSTSPTSLYKDVVIETPVDFYYLKQALVVIAPLPPDISGLK